MEEYWFKPKRFGYGATPIHWRGWASSFAAGIGLLSAVWAFGAARNGQVSTGELAIWVVLVACATLMFVKFARAKTNGEWKWRWGDPE
jgi:hypothetical protein